MMDVHIKSVLHAAVAAASAAIALSVPSTAAADGTAAGEPVPQQTSSDGDYVIVGGDMAVPEALAEAPGPSGGADADAWSAYSVAPAAGAAPIQVPNGTRGFLVDFGFTRNLGPYTLRLIESPGSEVEDLRPHLQAVLPDLTQATGHPFTLAPGTRTVPGGELAEPDTVGEIWVRLNDDSPCGALDSFTIGCGGPLSLGGAGYPNAGAIWISSAIIDGPAALVRATTRHELGHALGLSHYDPEYLGSRQLMHPNVAADLSTYQPGDINGLSYLAPGCDSRFTDVSTTNIFCDVIEYAAADGMIEGHADGTFRPSSAVSRQAMAAFLFRTDARSEHFVAPQSPSFPDVPLNHPFFTEIEWLAATGLTTGYSDGTFRPASPVTRQAIARYLHEFLSATGSEPGPSFIDEGAPGRCYFRDVARSSPFCADILWLAWNGVSTGYADGTYRPASSVSRQAAAAFLVRAVVAA